MKIPLKVRLLLRAMNLLSKPLEKLSPKKARADNHKLTDFTKKYLQTTSLEKVVNQSINGRHGAIPIRLYYPNKKKNLPIILYFHGGGWVLFNLDGYDEICRQLAQNAQALVISVDYRLAPENKFPIPVEDCYDSLLWVHQNATNIGGDATKIALAGDSAGGNLAAVMCLKSKAENGPKISHQTLIYPVTDATMNHASYEENSTGYLLTKNAMEWFIKHYIRDEKDKINPHCSPLLAENLQNLPPALVLTAHYDPLRDEGMAYAKKLKEAGNEVKLVNYENMVHGFYNMFSICQEAKDAANLVAGEIKKSWTKQI